MTGKAVKLPAPSREPTEKIGAMRNKIGFGDSVKLDSPAPSFSLFHSVELVMPMLFPRLLVEPGLNLLIAKKRVHPINQIEGKQKFVEKQGLN